MERSSARYTYQDLLALPESATRRHEILDGRLYVTAAPRVNHQRVLLDLGATMRAIAAEHALGEVVGPITVRVQDDLVFEPDLVFIEAERMDIANPDGRVHGVPDLVVEILPPSTRSYDRTLKRMHYLDAGVPELWLIDLDDRVVEVWRSGAQRAARMTDVLSWKVGDRSFPLRLKEIFRGISNPRCLNRADAHDEREELDPQARATAGRWT